jgi:hypothetical protein
MAQKKHKPEEIVAKLRQVDVLLGQGRPVSEAGSVQPLSHFRSCDGGSVGFVLRRAERRHVHVLAGRPLGAGPPPQGSLRHLERLIEPVGVLEWTVTRLEEPQARRLQVSERLRLRVGRFA